MPVPVAPAVIVIHASLLVAVQPHPVEALTVTMLEPPDARPWSMMARGRRHRRLRPVSRVKVWPPIVIVPVRDVVPGVGGDAVADRAVPTATRTGGNCQPPVVTCGCPAAASARVVTVTGPVVAADDAKFEGGRRDRERARGAGLGNGEGLPSDCDRPGARRRPVLAATLKLTEPLPLPLAPAVTVSQASLLTAVQLQPVPAVTVDRAGGWPADVARFDEVGAIVNVHGAPACVTVKVWPPIVIVPVRDACPRWRRR